MTCWTLSLHTTMATANKLSSNVGTLLEDPTYRRLAAAFHYLTFIGSDILCVVQQICMHMYAPRIDLMNAPRHILQYVKGTLSEGLSMHQGPISNLVSYTGADWAGCTNTRRSTSGYCVYHGDNLISWTSKYQFTSLVLMPSQNIETFVVAVYVGSKTSYLNSQNILLEHPLFILTTSVLFISQVT